MSVSRRFPVSLLLCFLAAAVALAQPVGPEFRVNTYTTNAQRNPRVALDSAGNFVVVWESWEQGGSYGIFAQRYASTGAPLGEFRVNTYTLEQEPWEGYPSVASDPAGNFVVVWASKAQDGSDSGIFGQRFSAACEASVQVKGDVHAPRQHAPYQDPHRTQAPGDGHRALGVEPDRPGGPGCGGARHAAAHLRAR
jgi:hypothetical protein